jgi:hypothetical protein
MKKKTKKLVLAKETVRELEGGDMRQAAAGAYTDLPCGPGDYSYNCASVRVICKYPPTTY